MVKYLLVIIIDFPKTFNFEVKNDGLKLENTPSWNTFSGISIA